MYIKQCFEVIGGPIIISKKKNKCKIFLLKIIHKIIYSYYVWLIL